MSWGEYSFGALQSKYKDLWVEVVAGSGKVYFRDAVVFKFPKRQVEEGYSKGVIEFKEPDRVVRNGMVLGMRAKEWDTMRDLPHARFPYHNMVYQFADEYTLWVVTGDNGPDGQRMVFVEFTQAAEYTLKRMRMLTGWDVSHFVRLRLDFNPSRAAIYLESFMGLSLLQPANRKIIGKHLDFLMELAGPQGTPRATFPLVNIFLILRTNLLLNCRNVVRVKQTPSAKTARKRALSGKPVWSYYTLKIRNVSSRCNGGLREIWTQRAHLCRGHYKHYTKDAPLFGRFVGMWWWNSQRRGSKTNGVIHKDYDCGSMLESTPVVISNMPNKAA